MRTCKALSHIYVRISPDLLTFFSVSFLDDCSVNAVFIENKITEIRQYGPIAEDSVIQALDVLLDQANYPGTYHSLDFSSVQYLLVCQPVCRSVRCVQFWKTTDWSGDRVYAEIAKMVSGVYI